MKVVHINKKNLEREEAIQRGIEEIQKKRSALEMKRFLRLNAKYEANKKAGLQPIKPEQTVSNSSIY